MVTVVIQRGSRIACEEWQVFKEALPEGEEGKVVSYIQSNTNDGGEAMLPT